LTTVLFKWLAELLGIPACTWHNYEASVTMPATATVAKAMLRRGVFTGDGIREEADSLSKHCTSDERHPLRENGAGRRDGDGFRRTTAVQKPVTSIPRGKSGRSAGTRTSAGGHVRSSRGDGARRTAAMVIPPTRAMTSWGTTRTADATR
jgi:hypothetical protein